jgi:hypothetical protein
LGRDGKTGFHWAMAARQMQAGRKGQLVWHHFWKILGMKYYRV